jgi:pimeloyl-ACP methyl ester carboxylesterase
MPRFAAKDGIELYYKDWGEGPAVVLIHGWPLNADMWESQALFLAEQGFRVISYDRRGFGRSEQPFSGYDYDTLTDDLDALLETLDLSQVTLVGFSMGGGEAARYLGRRGGARAARGVLISAVTPFLLKTPDHPGGVDAAVFDGMAQAVRKDRAQFLTDFAPGFYGNSLLEQKASPAVLQWFVAMAMMASPQATLACIRSFSETDFRKDLEAITVPMMVIHGSADKTVPIGVAGRRAAELLKNVQFLDYSGEAHGLVVTASERVNQDLLRFMTGG